VRESKASVNVNEGGEAGFFVTEKTMISHVISSQWRDRVYNVISNVIPEKTRMGGIGWGASPK
jgi:hypothetical protein